MAGAANIPTAEPATTRPNWRRVDRPVLEKTEVEFIGKTSRGKLLDR